MGVVETFGRMVDKEAVKNGGKAQKMLRQGYALQEWRLQHFPDKRLSPARRYLAWLVMHDMRLALKYPERTAMTSLFAPCEPLTVLGLRAFSVEGFSAFMTGTRAEGALLDAAEQDKDLCSYHRIYLGAEKLGLLPTSPFIISTSLACDANMITFPYLSETHKIPRFFIDVPHEASEDAVQMVKREIAEMISFIQDQTHKTVDLGALKVVIAREKEAQAAFLRCLDAMSRATVPGDVTSTMYELLVTHMLMGTPEALKYWQMLEDDLSKAGDDGSLKILWIHTAPFSQAPVRKILNFNHRAHILVADIAAESMLTEIDPNDPLGTMARRLVMTGVNGATERRIALLKDLRARLHPDGAVYFDHWGCKMNLGSSSLVKQALEADGLPTLILDGDGADMRQQSNGQTETRLEAFLEMLEARRD